MISKPSLIVVITKGCAGPKHRSWNRIPILYVECFILQLKSFGLIASAFRLGEATTHPDRVLVKHLSLGIPSFRDHHC